MNLDPFRTLVRAEGARLYRDLPWRNTRDPYAIWISEVMLQQTQVPRVLARWGAWLERFPSVGDLARADTADVLAAWQGMGYNRRALALKTAATTVVEAYDGVFPRDEKELTSLPGIGPATAQGIRSFAFDLPGVYLETNVRTVFLHQLFPDAQGVSDKQLIPLVRQACPGESLVAGPRLASDGCVPVRDSDTGGYAPDLDGDAALALAPAVDAGGFAPAQDADDTPRSWYYALLDYGAYLKKTIPNPSRRSKGYARQSKFEGSRRQKRAQVVRMLLAAREAQTMLTVDAIRGEVSASERDAGRSAVDEELVTSILADLEREGFCQHEAGGWKIA